MSLESTSFTAAGSPSPSLDPKARILYADDVRELRDVIRTILQREGYHIETVNDGVVAHDRLKQNPAEFDLLITDHHMPTMNGLELVRRLRSAAYHGKIMVFSSELDPAVHHEYTVLGVQSILPKPIRPATLRKALEEILVKAA